MITLHTWSTPNGRKISIALEELGLPYEVAPVNIGKNEQFDPAFLALSPNNKIPAIVDHDAEGGPLSIFESGAILTYLGEKTGRLLAPSGPARYRALEWVYWQVGGLGPMLGLPRGRGLLDRRHRGLSVDPGGHELPEGAAGREPARQDPRGGLADPRRRAPRGRARHGGSEDLSRGGGTDPREVRPVSGAQSPDRARPVPDPPRSSRLAEHLIDSETVVVAFSGLGTLEGGRHAFNFLSFSADATFSSILVRDPEDCWYHGSVPGIGRGCRALASHLAERTSGYRRVVCIGASMGGYAALLFGHLLGADRVLAFGPQVLLDPAVLRSFGDLRWIERIDRIQDLGVEPAFLDLSRLLVAAPASKTMFDVYVSADNHLDMRHAAPLLANPAVTVTPVRATRHNLVGPIRRFGILRRLLGRVVAGHPPLDVGVELATERERRRHDLALAGSVDVDPEARSLRLVTRVINTSPEVWDAATGFLAALSVECQVVESGTGRIVHRVGAGLPSSPMEPGDAGVRSFDLSYVGLPAGLYEAQVILCESGMRYEAIGCEPLTVGFELGPDVTPLWVRTPMGRTGRFGPAAPDRFGHLGGRTGRGRGPGRPISTSREPGGLRRGSRCFRRARA